MNETMVTAEIELATSTLEIQARINELTDELKGKKNELRDLANGLKKEIVVEGVGKINVSAPFEGSEKPILIFNEERLVGSPELRQKLIEKGVAEESVKKVPASVAKVTIKPNV